MDSVRVKQFTLPIGKKEIFHRGLAFRSIAIGVSNICGTILPADVDYKVKKGAVKTFKSKFSGDVVGDIIVR